MPKKIIVIVFVLNSFCNLAQANFCDDLSKKELGAKPDLKQGHHIHHEVKVEINKSPDEVKVWFDNLAPEKVIKGTASISGIKATCLLSQKAWGQVGSRRLVLKESGNTFIEEVLENEVQKYFRYQMWGFSKDLAHAISYADAYFEVKQIAEHKSVFTWHIAFKPRSFIYNIPISLFMKTSFNPFMKQSLGDIKNYIEIY